eukprot:1769168-Pyramimonas_sp.AAC.1
MGRRARKGIGYLRGRKGEPSDDSNEQHWDALNNAGCDAAPSGGFYFEVGLPYKRVELWGGP